MKEIKTKWHIVDIDDSYSMIHRYNVYVTYIVEDPVLHFKVVAGFGIVAKLGEGVEGLESKSWIATSTTSDTSHTTP